MWRLAGRGKAWRAHWRGKKRVPPASAVAPLLMPRCTNWARTRFTAFLLLQNDGGVEYFNTIVVQPHRKLVTNQGRGFHIRCRYQTRDKTISNAVNVR